MKRKRRKEEKAKKDGRGGGRGKQIVKEELTQEEICRSKMEVLTFSEVD